MGKVLWLLASLASVTYLVDGSPLKVMSAPNVLRVGTTENIFVECQDCTGGDILVHINVMDHPTKLVTTSVTLTSANNFQALGQIKIPAAGFSKDATVKQYVNLQAQFPDRLLEKVVLVSFHSGYIFIQTDKSLYTPDSKVLYRLFAVTPRMEPVEMNDLIDIEIMTPKGITLAVESASQTSGIHSNDFKLGENVSPGVWKVVAKFRNNPQQSYTAEFEVKDYVLPGFEVKLTPLSSFFYVDSPDLTVIIKASYLFGEEVTGTAYVVFGVVHEGQKRSFPNALQRVAIENGAGVAKLKREHITQTFQNIDQLVGSSIFVAVSVLTESGSEMVEAEVRGIQIVTSPYTIHYKRTPKYFKPGMSFDVSIEVVNPDETPAKGVAVMVNPGEVNSLTAANGLVKLTINTEARASVLRITATTRDPRISPERQASATMVALPYKTKSNSYINIDVYTAELQLGDNLKFILNLNRPSNQDTDITYLILSRGQLIRHGHYRTRGQVMISLTVPIIKDMLPSFRIIAYYHPNDNEVVSDSVWVDVKDSCMGSLKLEPLRPATSYEPRRVFGLKVTGDPGATVGLVAVDKGVFLNNKHRLTQKKVWDIVEKYDTGCTPGGGKDGMNVFYDAGLLFESSTASGTPYRQELKCPAPSRRRRQTPIMDVTSSSNSYMDSNEIVSRTRFPESWLWTDIILPSCNTPNCAFNKNVPLPDSITTWQLTGISLSTTHGICVSEPLEVIVRKDFFIDLMLPYSAVRGEQLEIKAILHNYSPDFITVRVDLTKMEDVCSIASKRTRYRQDVTVGPLTKRSVPFIIIPMKYGRFKIEVKAAVKNLSLNDGVMKMLRVVPEGVLIKSVQTIILDPSHKDAGGKQEEILNSGIPKKDWVPNTPTGTQISVTGSEVGPLVENVISGESMTSLIQLPHGCGEHNMIHMTLPVIATMYLDKTNQWETVGVQRRNETLQHIRTGYNNELAFRKRDGSFSAWPRAKSSTWLTAYVVKVFAMSYNLVEMQKNVICDAVKFLISNAQQPDGMFREVGRVIHREMSGDVQGSDSDASMTAFCLIAMQESRKLCADTVSSLPGSTDKAVAYLERRLSSLTNPYAVAMSSYALANEDKLNREIFYNFASPELSHWNVPKGSVYTLEATAYALLALVKAKALEEARPIVRWFNKQQRDGGGYGSTQATMIVYQAVAEYWASAQEQEYDLYVDIHLPHRAKPEKINFNRNNHHTTRTLKFSDINQDVKVTATGTGEATLKMVSLYYALPKEKESDCQKFNLSVELIPEKMDEDEAIYKLRIEVLYKNKDHDATMSILDIGLLTGFTVNTNDLDLLAQGRARTIAKYEMDTVLSERGSLIIYLDKVSHTRSEEITFRIHQTLKVGVMQPAAVSVYEYDDQTQCVKFYHPERKDGQLLRLCRDAECTCAEENCSMQKKGKISNDLRTAKPCESTPTSKIDFVYKVRVEEFTDGLTADIYTMRIMEVIKEGYYDVGSLGTFLSLPRCRWALDLVKGKTYLIMGTLEDVYQPHQYVLSERTWIEYWPTEAECGTDEHRSTCLGLEEMVTQYTLFGCLL
ncbi:complement C3-like isoform X2 [Solea solea]|uniref:complement C3-like isoform X2 n=1 Tax=Solea solea TaxID=90069 RepID=UPI00272C999C|nr:complement C3-like isoform X2 [Solea solea]